MLGLWQVEKVCAWTAGVSVQCLRYHHLSSDAIVQLCAICMAQVVIVKRVISGITVLAVPQVTCGGPSCMMSKHRRPPMSSA